MIKPLSLGNRHFPINIIQGPLAGYSTAPFRHLTWKYGAPAFSCTEMISSKALIHQPKATARYVKKHPEEGPVCFQLSGNTPQELAQAAKIVIDHGADLIDLNCGCPVNKIRRKNLGSSLLSDPAALYHLIYALKKNSTVPVSIKIRVAGDSTEQLNQEIATVVQEAGADFLIVHGRHWTENYDTPCRYDDIAFFAQTVNLPVIGNGDIRCVASLQEMFATGCAGVMIARAGVGQPWLTQQLIAQASGKSFHKPNPPTIGNMFIEHIVGLTELLSHNKFTIVQARKLAKYYARGLPHKIDFIHAINHCHTLDEMRRIVAHHFTDRHADADLQI